MSKLDGVSNKRVESDKAFEILVRQSHRHLLAYALSLVRQVSDAEDIVQDAFVVAYRKLAEFDASRDFGSWMRGIIRLKYLEWARSRKEIIADNETLESIEQAHVLWAEAGADGRADALHALRECIAKLADGVQQAVHLFYTQMKRQNRVARLPLALSLTAWLAWGAMPTLAATHTAASCFRADVQAAVNAASDGDTVLIPAGTATWTSGITINKGIHLKGAGGGRVEGSSATSHVIGIGSKTFAIQSGSIVSAGFTAGETVRVVYKARGEVNWMEGVITSWNGTTLALNVTSTGGSGTYAAWTFVAPAKTTIATGAEISLFTIYENTERHVELSDMRLVESADALSLVLCHPTAGGKKLLFHDIRYTAAYCAAFDFRMNGGVLWHIYGDAGFDFSIGTVFGVIRVKYSGGAGGWNSVNCMGTADVDGDKNLYIESSYFCGLGVTDWDDNARGVFRYNVLDNASAMSHGADTSGIGGMHVEYYNNLCIFDNLGTDTINLQGFLESRGGTGIVADNVIPDVSSSMWGNKPEIKLQIQVLDRDAGLFGLWGQGVVGAQYPAPRQVGMGHANSGYTNHSVTFAHANVNLATGLDVGAYPAYLGDLCPWYQWGNTGGGSYASPGIGMSGYNVGTPDNPADYIQVGRDWINGGKPGYAKYTYPHPLTQAQGLPALPEGPGLAAAYPGDAGITGHPAVLFADDFESYDNAGQLTTRWNESYHLANTRIATETNNVFAGSKAVEFRVPIQTTETSNTAIKHLSPKEDVLFVRCYTKFDPGFLTYGSSHNGLGIQANYSGPGIPANGTNKFYVGQENSGFGAETPPGPTHLYVYHPEQRDIWGDHWYPDGRVVPFDYLPGDYGPYFVPRQNFTPDRNRWYCIELMVKANTPGQRDGRVAYWIDGNLAADFFNIRLRDVDTLKIDKFFIGFHINGTTTRINTKWYDNVVAARSYIGPMSSGASDTNAPSVSLSAPVMGAIVTNVVTVSATATDNVAVAGVRFRLDGVDDLGAEDTSVPYYFSWNTAFAANGVHALSAVARDTAGNLTTSAFIVVTVTNQGGQVFGHTGEGATTDYISDASGSYINASRFLADSALPATVIRAKVLGITGKYKCAIYSDAAGTPQALLGTTAEVTNPVTGWQSFPLGSEVSIEGGQAYWLAIWSDLHSTVAGIYCESSGGTTRWTELQAYGSWPNPLVTVGSGSVRYCIYAEGIGGGEAQVNGIPASWLIRHFGATNAMGGAATDDPDHDGHDNLAEYIAGTVPTNALSVLRILALEPIPEGMCARFQGVSGRRYSLQYKGDLPAPDWSLLITDFPGAGVEAWLSDTNPAAPRRFYRVGVRLE